MTHIPSKEDLQVLDYLRQHRREHRQNLTQAQSSHLNESSQLTVGQRISDIVASTVGSWRFIIFQSIAIIAWIAINTIYNKGWDPYPFILLNLMLSFQAAYTAPIIMMSQNRLSEIDRQQASNDFEINVKSELEIELLHQKIDMLREKELLALAKAVENLSAQIQSYAASQTK
jgi:uncharacterized membrane protein